MSLDGVAETPDGDMVSAVTALKAGEGGPILVGGSAARVRDLLAAGLVDELRLLVFSVLIGGGLTIWPDDRSRHGFALERTTTFSGGAQLQVYRAVR